ncbi:protein tyrosine phosphatase domain-containing protein 1-like [Argonauta hians]
MGSKPEIESSERDDIFQWESNNTEGANIPDAHFNVLTEQAQSIISLKNQCVLFCGGRNCKYDRSDCWKGQMAIHGTFSHWATQNILAMARPSQENMKHIVKQFISYKVKSVINLQEKGEHASCGAGLQPSGFSYNPEDFMSKNIYYYNFACHDYGTMSKGRLLDIVRVMQFSISQGKVAIHCHAGLGRTGLLICCYLVFTYRISANKAINYLRARRPKSIQTRRQMACLREFVEFLQNLWNVFPTSTSLSCEFTLQQYMVRQRKLLHGYKLRHLKYIPQIIYYICERLLELANRGNTEELFSMNNPPVIPSASCISISEEEIKDIPYYGATSSVDGKISPSISVTVQNSKNPDLNYEFAHVVMGNPNLTPCRNRTKSVDFAHTVKIKSLDDLSVSTAKTKSDPGTSVSDESEKSHVDNSNAAEPTKDTLRVAIALCQTTFSQQVVMEKDALKHEVNLSENGWKLVVKETNPDVLVALLWEWLNRLQEPILRYRDLKTLLTYSNDPFLCLSTLEKSPHTTIEYFSKVVARLMPLPDQLLTNLLQVLLSHLTHCYICLDPCNGSWEAPHWMELTHLSSFDLIHFFKCLLRVHQQRII